MTSREGKSVGDTLVCIFENSFQSKLFVYKPACCVAVTAVCAGRWCSAAGFVGGAASAGGTPSQAGWAPRVEEASGPEEQMVSKLPGRKWYSFQGTHSFLVLGSFRAHLELIENCPRVLLPNQRLQMKSAFWETSAGWLHEYRIYWMFAHLKTEIQDKFYLCCRSEVEITVLCRLNSDKQHGEASGTNRIGSEKQQFHLIRESRYRGVSQTATKCECF